MPNFYSTVQTHNAANPVDISASGRSGTGVHGETVLCALLLYHIYNLGLSAKPRNHIFEQTSDSISSDLTITIKKAKKVTIHSSMPMAGK